MHAPPLVLILLFNSIIQPLLVMMAVPFGIIGVIIAFMLHGEPLSFTSMIGVIGHDIGNIFRKKGKMA